MEVQQLPEKVKKRRNDFDITLEIFGAIHDLKLNGDVTSIYQIMRKVNVGHNRLKRKISSLEEKGALFQEQPNRYSLTGKGTDFLNFYRKEISPIVNSVFPEEINEKEDYINLMKEMKRYKDKTSKDYLVDGQINWIKLYSEYIEGCRQSGEEIINYASLENDILTQAEVVRGNRFTLTERRTNRRYIQKITSNLLFLSSKLLK